MAIETDITKLVFNKMSQEKYEELKANGELVNNEFYITPDSNIDIDIPENVVEADNYVNAKLWKGTLAEYESLESYDDSVTYIITDDVVEGGTIVSIDAYTKSETDEFLNAKQDVLVSGTNIKTINGESILGEGDYVIDVDTSEIENNINTLNNELTTVKTDLNNKLDTTQITNCITEIPQDIKFEIDSNGKCWLKAGSKCYKPNGTIINITTDLPVGRTSTAQEFIGVNGDGTRVALNVQPSRCYSGTTAPTGFTGYGLWLDTNSMTYKYSIDGGTTWTDGDYSLPIALVTMKNVDGEVSSIDQVFNGFGYIGSTVFALPGVKGLIPNGINADGSLKNTVRTAPSVIVHNINPAWGNVGAMKSLWWNNALTVQPVSRFTTNKQLSGQAITFSYVESQNIWSETSDNGATWLDYRQITPIADINFDGSKITSFTLKFPFRAIDYSDKPEISGWGMPSDKYIDLTLGATGTSYTAPANGWFAVIGDPTGTDGNITLFQANTSIGSGTIVVPDTTYVNTRISICCTKGQSVILHYNRMNITVFRFYYAEGEK